MLNRPDISSVKHSSNLTLFRLSLESESKLAHGFADAVWRQDCIGVSGSQVPRSEQPIQSPGSVDRRSVTLITEFGRLVNVDCQIRYPFCPLKRDFH